MIQVFTALTGTSGELAAVTRDVLAGIEEEGVPYAVTTVAEDVPVADLADRKSVV